MNIFKFEEKNCFKGKEFNQNFNFSLNKISEPQINSLFTKTNEIINNNQNSVSSVIGILNSKFYLIKKIGCGSTGSVYLSYSIHDEKVLKTLYAIKLLNTNESNVNIINSCELNFLEKINHKNIVKIYRHGLGLLKTDCGIIQQVYYIIMDYLNHGSLLSQIDGNKGFGENFGRLIFAQLLDGLEAIHNSNIVHRDIKLENIMLSGDDYTLKYVDFGFATEKSYGYLNNYLGTPNYAAPELHLKKPYLGVYEDIFSLGVTLFNIVTGYLPSFLSSPNDPLYHYNFEIDYINFLKKRNVTISYNFMELFDNLVAFEPSQRPSINEIKNSKWMKEINWKLFPYLKEEFMKREKIFKQNIINKKEKPMSISLENRDQINNNNINNIDKFLMKIREKEKEIENEIKKQVIPMNNIIEDDKNERIGDGDKYKNKISNNNLIQNSIIFKSEIKSIHQLMALLKKFLIKKGYILTENNLGFLNMEISNGEIDINLKLEKKKEYIKISFISKDEDKQDFINFKNLIIQFIQMSGILIDNLSKNNLYTEKNKIVDNINNTIIKNNLMQGFINFKLKNKNVIKLMSLLRKYLKKYGYALNKEDKNNLKMEISNGEIDIILKFERMNKYIKISFDVKNGNEQNFINFKKLMTQFSQNLQMNIL